MVLPTASWSDVGLILLTALALWLPGGLVLLASSLRGWHLACAAPLATYGMAGVGGPLFSALGVPWRTWALPALTALFVFLALGVRLLRSNHDGRSRSNEWEVRAHLAVIFCVVLAAGIGLMAVLVGIKNLAAIPQDWDAVFHANGIRWIVETGDSGLDGMSQVNWYGSAAPVYYPNAYHLVAATATSLSGQSIPAVLNANTVLIPGILALGLASLVRTCGGRAVTAGFAAVLVVGMSAFYDMLWRGPLLPFAMGVALIPALLVIVLRYLRPPGLRARLPVIVPLALATSGMFGLHPGALIAAALFAVCLVAARWVDTPHSIATEAIALVVGAVVSVALVIPSVLGSLTSAAEASNDWPAVATAATALGETLLFGTAASSVQVWLAILLAIGCLAALRLRPLGWILAPAAVFALLYVLATASDAPLVETVTRPWWNDRFRLIGIATLPLAVLCAHGLAQVSDFVVDQVRRVLTGFSPRRTATPVAAVVAAAALGSYLVVTGGSYLGRNEVRMQNNTGNGPAVSSEELQGFQVLGRMVAPGTRVMNDRGDGSAWMYAMAGVLPVAAHYNADRVDSDAQLLAQRFNAYDTDPSVRAAAARLRVGWVVVDQGFLRPNAVRQVGLENLDRVRALTVAYRNPDMTVYRLAPA